MSDVQAQFRGTIPEFYHRYLGPFLFEPYARDLAARLHVPPGARVLEIACGTGIATRRLRQAIPANADLVATDLNPGMIERARLFLPGANIHWRTADGCALPFKDGAFDAVVCQFGFMFFPDRETGFAEARRVLRPGGVLVASVWDTLAENPAAAIVHAAAARMFEDSPPGFMLVPYGSLDRTTMQALAHVAGFAEAEIVQVRLEGRSPSAHHVATGFAKGSPLSVEMLERGGDLDEAAEFFERELLAHGGTPFRSPLAAYVLVAS